MVLETARSRVECVVEVSLEMTSDPSLCTMTQQHGEREKHATISFSSLRLPASHSHEFHSEIVLQDG